MKKAYIIALLVISTAMGFTMWAFSSAATPYVTISQARNSAVAVQVRGKILHDAGSLHPGETLPHYDSQQHALRFWIEDVNGERIEVMYQGAKPEAFDQAPETAAYGMIRGNRLISDRLVVKCPSKYEGGKPSPYKATGGKV